MSHLDRRRSRPTPLGLGHPRARALITRQHVSGRHRIARKLLLLACPLLRPHVRQHSRLLFMSSTAATAPTCPVKHIPTSACSTTTPWTSTANATMRYLTARISSSTLTATPRAFRKMETMSACAMLGSLSTRGQEWKSRTLTTVRIGARYAVFGYLAYLQRHCIADSCPRVRARHNGHRPCDATPRIAFGAWHQSAAAATSTSGSTSTIRSRTPVHRSLCEWLPSSYIRGRRR